MRGWPDERHKTSARALETRGLVRVRRKNKVWNAEITESGRYYLDHGRCLEPPELEPRIPASQAGDHQIAELVALTTARRAIRQATTSSDRRALSAARARTAQGTAHPSLLKDIPMRYKIVVSRVQTAERHVRATTEEDAIRKVQEELERPYDFLGGWATVGTDMDIVAAESVLGGGMPAQINQDGGFLLSVKAAAKHLGASISVMYELVNRGEIAHVMIGSRRYISRDQISAFIETNTHTGYYRRH